MMYSDRLFENTMWWWMWYVFFLFFGLIKITQNIFWLQKIKDSKLTCIAQQDIQTLSKKTRLHWGIKTDGNLNKQTDFLTLPKKDLIQDSGSHCDQKHFFTILLLELMVGNRSNIKYTKTPKMVKWKNFEDGKMNLL